MAILANLFLSLLLITYNHFVYSWILCKQYSLTFSCCSPFIKNSPVQTQQRFLINLVRKRTRLIVICQLNLHLVQLTNQWYTIPTLQQELLCRGKCHTWIVVNIIFGRSRSWFGKSSFIQSFASSSMLGLLNTASFSFPRLFSKSQLHCEHLQDKEQVNTGKIITAHTSICMKAYENEENTSPLYLILNSQITHLILTEISGSLTEDTTWCFRWQSETATS